MILLSKFINIDNEFDIVGFYQSVFNRLLPKGYEFTGEKHNFWEIEYVVSKQLEITEEENVYILKSGDIIFHAPMEFHKLNVEKNAAPHLINISFKISGNPPKSLSDGFFSLNDTEKDEFLKIVHKVNDYVTGQDTSLYVGQEAGNMLSNFIIQICNNKKTTSNTSNSTSAMTYKTLVELMNHNVMNNLSLEDFAKKCFISVSYIKSLFYRYAGISPKVYYNNLRLAKAQDLLKQGLSVSEISEAMNFSSSNYFTAFFKKYTNTTPLQYKKDNN